MATKAGTFTKSTDGAPASQSVTGVGFKPRALILWTAGATSTGAWNDNYLWAMGLAARDTSDAITVGSVAWASQDNQDTSNASQRAAVKALTIVQWGETTLAECDLSSFDSDGFTLSWTTNDGNAYIIHYMALAGANLTNASVVGWAVPASTGNYGITGAGFTPDCVIHIGSGITTLNTNAASARSFVGAMTTAAQWVSEATVRDAQGTMYTMHHQRVNKTIYYGAVSSGAVDVKAIYVSMDADGFTVDFTDAGAGERVFSLCLAGGNYALGMFSGNSTAVHSITGVGFQPEGILFIGESSINNTTENSLSHTARNVGATDGVSQTCLVVQDTSGIGTSNTAGWPSTTRCVMQDSGGNQTIDSDAVITSLDADGFTITWQSGWLTALSELYFAFAGGSVAITLVVDDATHSHSADTAALTQVHILVVQEATHADTADIVALTQTHILAIDDGTHAHIVDSPALTQDHILAVQDGAHAHVADVPILTQAHSLAVQDATHSHSADGLILTQVHVLTIQDAVHNQTADGVVLTQIHILAIQDARHSHYADALVLVQLHQLLVEDALHAHVADNVLLGLRTCAWVTTSSVWLMAILNQHVP